jgi:hypothetical protein
MVSKGGTYIHLGQAYRDGTCGPTPAPNAVTVNVKKKFGDLFTISLAQEVRITLLVTDFLIGQPELRGSDFHPACTPQRLLHTMAG